ncbi:MAG: DUF5114 domain-containing protein [Muribaculaceae bacterium]|nr:DUF5114 domain-containing protein [Muribaculaceae bacterium]
MKLHTKYIGALALGALALAACEKDGDTIYVSEITDPTLENQGRDIVLDENNLDALALTVYWNDNGDITLSDPMVAAPAGAFTNTFQLSAFEDFSTAYEEILGQGVCYRQFTVGELNSAALRGGMESGTTAKVYVRLKSVLGANIEPRYSNVISFNLTTYMVDMTIGAILDSNKLDSGRTLALSGDADNVFAGFFGAGSWENWFFRDPSGEIWGTASDPGKAFMLGKLSTDAALWNLWFPEPAGCYYTVMNLGANEWTALYLPELTLSGDIDGVMSYDRKTNLWSYTFMADARTYSVSISGKGSLYDHTSGDGAPAATDVPAGFAGSADGLSFGTTASPVSFTVAQAGETTLILDLSNPKQWTLGTGELETPEIVPELLYLPGITDPWDFETFVKLYNEDNKTYGAVNYIKSEWGYQIAIEKDNWGDIYTMVAGGNAFEGSLEFQGKNNITAPEEGIYLMDISLSGLFYKLTPVTSVSCTGMNDDWNLTPMTATDSPCVFTAELQKTANTPWGVKIILNDNWDLFFGGNGTDGELALYRDGFTGDNDFAEGSTIILTVDLAKGTYSYSQK